LTTTTIKYGNVNKSNPKYLLYLVQSMRPQDIMKLIQSQIKRITGQDSATKYFEQQQEALASIKNTS